MNFWGFVFIFLTCIFSSRSEIKTWVQTTDFNYEKNWADGTLPCASDRIIFPNELQTAIVLPSSELTLHELVLPRNGEIVLDEKNRMFYNSKTNTKSCVGRDKFFKSVKIEAWLNPYNWELAVPNQATPHMNRIPCIYDHVSIPVKKGVYIQMPETKFAVDSMDFNGRRISQNELQTYLFTEVGSRQFKSGEYQIREQIISIKPFMCKDKSGCLCHVLDAQKYSFLESLVCQYAKPMCPVSHCLSPIRPIGHCCGLCGSYLLFKYNAQFNINDINSFLTNYMTNYPTIAYFVNKVMDGEEPLIQIILTSKNNYNHDSATVASTLREAIENSVQLKPYVMKQAGVPYYEYTTIGSGQFVFSTFVVVLVTFTIIYLIFYPVNERSRSIFNFLLPSRYYPFRQTVFARFENPIEGDGTLEIGSQSVASSLFNIDIGTDNPLYDEPIATCSENLKINYKNIEDSTELLGEEFNNLITESQTQIPESEVSI